MDNKTEALDVAEKVDQSDFFCPSCGADLSESIKFGCIVVGTGSIKMVNDQARVVLDGELCMDDQTGNLIVQRANCSVCDYSVYDLIRNTSLYIPDKAE